MNHCALRPSTATTLRNRRGFTLVEMIGVLAVIGILAAVILPRVFSAITTSRVNGTVVGINSVKAAVTSLVGKYGSIPSSNSNNSRIDDLLVAEGLLEQRFTSKLGLQADPNSIALSVWTKGATGTWTVTGGGNFTVVNHIRSWTSAATAPDVSAGRNFMLDGATNLPTGAVVVSAFLHSVPAAEARELSQRIDGDSMTAADNVTADNLGKVVYNTPPATGLVDVYVYITHQ